MSGTTTLAGQVHVLRNGAKLLDVCTQPTAYPVLWSVWSNCEGLGSGFLERFQLAECTVGATLLW